MNALIDAAGQQFGFLVATEVDRHPRWKGKPRWRCRCICGNETFVVGNKLRSGETTSCGCEERAEDAVDVSRAPNRPYVERQWLSLRLA